MKKGILFPVLALGMGLFSCSQEDLGNSALQAGQPITVTVKLPDDAVNKAASRYIPSASDDQHQLRCILLVTNGDNSTIRIEKLASEANGDTFSYTFTPKDASNYKCAFWADFIDADADVTGEGNDKKYADLYYDTQNLPSVSYNTGVTTDGSLFNNEDCDAYCGTIPTGGSLSINLKRPFAKVSFEDKGTTASSASSISVSGYGVYGGFNIETNEVVETETLISGTGIEPVKTDNVFFYNYLFVGNKNELPDGDKQFSLIVDGTTKTISTENITLTSNTEVNGSFDWGSASGSVTVTVDFNDTWIDPNAPKAGDYYYSDGTWSATLNSEKTAIGVVFAVKGDGSAIDSDMVDNYSSVTFKDNAIHGWVVSLKEITPTPRFASSSDGQNGATVSSINGVNTETTDIKGYANCSAWKINTLTNEAVYTALPKAESYAADYLATLPVTGTSGWYIGAIAQMDVLRSAYNVTDSKVKAALQALEDDSKADLFATGIGGSSYYWSSTANQGADKNSVRTIVFDASVESYMSTHNGDAGRHCRPILTF
ncbi:hypothetical protein [Phocaeicola plebeius]|uniref:hypothetical protein n=1 Tax=Phocaeicola plebeius TaxID=310297 RepID=UPI0026EC8E17|nr:hypothetical protein [Phocaeicola plebeius]